MRQKPRIELLAPNLDIKLEFVPGYDLLESASTSMRSSELCAIALALWELTGEPPPDRSLWRESHLDNVGEGRGQ